MIIQIMHRHTVVIRAIQSTYSASEHVVHECTQRPPVDSLAVTAAHQNLRRPARTHNFWFVKNNIGLLIWLRFSSAMNDIYENRLAADRI